MMIAALQAAGHCLSFPTQACEAWANDHGPTGRCLIVSFLTQAEALG